MYALEKRAIYAVDRTNPTAAVKAHEVRPCSYVRSPIMGMTKKKKKNHLRIDVDQIIIAASRIVTTGGMFRNNPRLNIMMRFSREVGEEEEDNKCKKKGINII